MESVINKHSILEKTHYGTNIYSHILREYYPNEIVMKITGRDCGLCRNPFNENKETLHVWINTIETDGHPSYIARHEDTENVIPSGDVFDFAELHFKQQGEELLQTINKELFLHIGEKRDFYSRNVEPQRVTAPNPVHLQTSPTQSLPLGEVGGACFSFFRAPISNTTPLKAISLFDAYKYITGNYAKQRTEKLRSFDNVKRARTFKAANFDYCTFSGTFNNRNDKALIQHSGLLCIDFDHLQNVDLLRNQLLQDEYFETQLLFRSPSGDGLKWIIPIDTSQTTHGNYFASVSNYIQQTYGVEVDKSGRDISRACFLPYDPQAYLNPLYNF